MSFTSEFETLLNEEKKKAQGMIGLFNAYSQELVAKQQAPEPSGIEILQAGALGDGYQIGDISKIILGTAGDAAVGVGKGFFSFAEGVADAVGYGIYGLRRLFGETENDLADYKRDIAASTADKVFGGADDFLDEYSVLGRTTRGVAEGVGQLIPMVATAGVAGAAGLSAKGASLASSVVLGTSSFGSGMSEAYQGGATDEEALVYGATSAATEVLTERLFGGLGKGVNAVGFNKGALPLDDMTAKAVSKFIKSETGKNVAEYVVKSGFEGAEEAIAGYIQAHAKKGTFKSEEDFAKILEDENLFEQFIVGAFVSGGAQVGDLRTANKTGRDFVTGNTQNEQAVIDKEVENRIAQEEKGGKNLSEKEKSAIYDQVVKDMERGYISTETIESVLGKDALSEYDALSKEAEEFKTLYETEGGKLSEKQKDRLAELKEKNKANPYENLLKAEREKISEDVFELAQNDRLRESYREQTRKGEKFQADVSKYSEAQRKTVQNAIDSGILNNTNRSHEFVDLIAKISADKGISFDFADNAKLKESGFALDGVLVNGFVNENGVTINVQSAKALNRVVGHEITHVLEGTELYDALQSAVTEYAKGKKEYDSRLKELTELYEGKNANVEQELVADLVGDYLFTDADFIKHLSTEHRSLFQKIYDEIKYLCKIVTAGTKEARQLEKVKKAFADAYRAETKNPTAEGGVRYSLAANAKTELHKALYDTKYRDDVRLRDVTPAIMLGHKGVENLPMAMRASHIRENVFTEDEARKLGLRVDDDTHYHGLGEELFLQVIDGLDNVKEAYRGTKNASDPTRREDYFLLVSEFTDTEGNTINVPVYINRHAQVNRVFVDVNKISTVYGKEALRDYIKTQVKNQNLVRIKRRSIESSERAAPVAAGYRDDTSSDSIRDPKQNVNSKNSLSKKDFSIAPPVGADVYGKDIGYDIAPPIPESVPRTNKARPKVGDPAYAPIAEGAAEQGNQVDRMQEADALYGPWRMKDPLDIRVEKLFRMMLREQISEEEYVAQLVKADRLYQKRGEIVEAALERVRETYSRNSVTDADSDQMTMPPETETKMVRLTRKVLHKSRMETMREALEKEGYDLDELLSGAKRLSTFATVDNTPQRVIEKTFGYKAGQIINDLTVNKVALNESEGIQWLNDQVAAIKNLSKKYGIKPGSKESRAAQIYGEGFWVNEAGEYITYGDAELAADFPDVKKQERIKKLAKDPEVRKMYDETLEAINEVRVRNGYPPIPKRADYFLHFRAMDDTFSRLGVPFNPNDIKAKDLPTDLNGVTADLKPGKPFFASEMQRKGDRTAYDLLGGMERYMNSAKNQIYHVDDIQTFRAFRNYIADMFGQENGLSDLDSLSPEEQEIRIKEVFDGHLSTFAKFLNEEANILAGKTALIDRGIEGVLGRRAIQFLHTLNSQVGKNMVGWNVSSAGTNVLPIVQAMAKLPKVDMVRAFVQTVSNKFQNDGFVENDPALIRRRGADQFAKTFWQKISDPGYALMSAVDNLASEMIVRAKYNELVRKQWMDSRQAHIRAGEWASRLMGDRSLGQMPQLYNSKTLGLITKFQLEVRNQLDAMGYDTIQEAKAENMSTAKKAAKITSTMVQLAIFQHLFGQAFEAIAGYNPTFDIVENLIKLFGFDDDEESEDTFGDNLEQAFLGLLEDLPYTSTFTGGRIPIESALPIEEVITGKDSYGNEKDRMETIGEALPYYILPGGYGQIKKTAAGLQMFDEDLPVAGSYTDSGNLRFPVEATAENVAQAAVFGQYASANARDYFDNDRSTLKEKQIHAFMCADMSIQEYWAYRDGLSAIEADKDADGKTINGSKKEKVIKYIEDLDISDDAKHILLKYEYPSDDTYNFEIIDYLNSRTDLSYTEIKTILEELGFTVDAKGRITWD